MRSIRIIYYLCSYIKTDDMASQIHLTPEETLDWLIKVATADGLLSPTERTTIREFAKSYGIKADVILEAASKSLVGNKPEVEIIDYRAKTFFRHSPSKRGPLFYKSTEYLIIIGANISRLGGENNAQIILCRNAYD